MRPNTRQRRLLRSLNTNRNVTDMALNKTLGALATSLLATALTAQNVVHVGVGMTNSGTSGNELFFVHEDGDATAYLKAGSDAVVLLGGPVFGGSCDTADCVGDDYVYAVNNRWELIKADWDDLLLVEAGDAVHLRDCTVTVTPMTGQQYNAMFFDYWGSYPWEIDPYQLLDWTQEPC
ncbi:MAG: hypothetical protein ACI89X_000435 [Planctomycetota bacterium]|jgi:hypothetical protein